MRAQLRAACRLESLSLGEIVERARGLEISDRGALKSDTVCVAKTLPRVCYTCKKEGHFARNCPGKLVCFTCGKPGHIASKCEDMYKSTKND